MSPPAIVAQTHVWSALILRDVNTRFGGKSANYLVAIGWPLVHVAVLLIIYSIVGRVAPIGMSAPLYFATGVLPFVTFSYPARFVMMCTMQNRPLLAFPVVKLADLLFARVMLEVVTSFSVILLCGLILSSLGVPMIPRDPDVAVAALTATLALAVGLGLINSLMQMVVPFWFIVFVLFNITLYAASGIIFEVDGLPEKVRYYLSFNPVLQGVVWFRSAYYPDYGRLTLDREYMVYFALALVFMGVAGERLMRRYLLAKG